MHLLRGLNQRTLKPFYWFSLTIFMAGNSCHPNWSFVPISTISWPKNHVSLRGFRYVLRSFLPNVTHCLTYSSPDQKWWFFQGDRVHYKMIVKSHMIYWFWFLQKKGSCTMALGLTPWNQNTVFTCCIVPGPFTFPFSFNLYHNSWNLISSLFHRGRIESQKSLRDTLKATWLKLVKWEFKLKSFDSSWYL